MDHYNNKSINVQGNIPTGTQRSSDTDTERQIVDKDESILGYQRLDSTHIEEQRPSYITGLTELEIENVDNKNENEHIIKKPTSNDESDHQSVIDTKEVNRKDNKRKTRKVIKNIDDSRTKKRNKRKKNQKNNIKGLKYTTTMSKKNDNDGISKQHTKPSPAMERFQELERRLNPEIASQAQQQSQYSTNVTVNENVDYTNGDNISNNNTGKVTSMISNTRMVEGKEELDKQHINVMATTIPNTTNDHKSTKKEVLNRSRKRTRKERVKMIKSKHQSPKDGNTNDKSIKKELLNKLRRSNRKERIKKIKSKHRSTKDSEQVIRTATPSLERERFSRSATENNLDDEQCNFITTETMTQNQTNNIENNYSDTASDDNDCDTSCEEDTYEQVSQNSNIQQDYVIADAVTTDDIENRVLEQVMERMGQQIQSAVVVNGEIQQDTNHLQQQQVNQESKRSIGSERRTGILNWTSSSIKQLLERMGRQQTVPITVLENIEEVQQDDTTTNNNHQMSQESNRFTKKQQRLFIWSCLLCFSIIIIIIGTIFGNYNDKKSNHIIYDLNDNGNVDDVDDQNNTIIINNILMPQDGKLFELLRSSYNDNNGLYDESSPQYKAFLWLSCDPYVTSMLSKRRRRRRTTTTRSKRILRSLQTKQKQQQQVLQQKSLQQYNTHTQEQQQQQQQQQRQQQRRLEYCNLQESFFPIDEEYEPMILERYALATLFYSTSSSSSSSSMTTTTDLTDDNNNNIFDNVGWKRYDNWLSDKHICEWYLGSSNNNDNNNNPCDERKMTVSILNLNSNGLIGTIPNELILLRRLNIFDISNNNKLNPYKFIDLIRWMRTIRTLTTINVSRNQFFGQLPIQLADLTNLVNFDIGYNLISGSVPVKYNLWKSIESIHVEGNNITGEIPYNLCHFITTNSVEFYADCNEVYCPCCTYCCRDDNNNNNADGGCKPYDDDG